MNQESITKPKYHFDLENLTEADYEWLANLLDTSEENVKPSSFNQQNIGQNQIQNNQPTKVGTKNVKVIHTNQENFKELVEKYTGINADQSQMQLDADEKKNICNECGKKFRYKSRLNRHVKEVHQSGEKPFECNWDGCGQRFATKANRQNHELIIHRPNEMHFECNWEGFGKKFAHQSDLRKHEQSSHGTDRPFTCQQCGMSLKRNDHLIAHKQIHQKENKFFCQKCGQSFNIKRYLTRHQKKKICA